MAPAVPVSPGSPDDTLRQVTDVFARVLEMPPGRLDPDLTFENYGVDSLVVLEVTRALEAVYGPQPASLLFERITIRQLAGHFGAGAPSPGIPDVPVTTPEPTTPAVPGPAPADGAERLVAGLSDAAVDELLAELLSQRGESEGDGR